MFPDPPPELANLPGFPKAWEQFGVMRQTVRKPLTPYAATLLLNRLLQRPTDAVALLDLCIQNCWQGAEWSWLDKHRLARSGEGPPQSRGKPPSTASSTDLRATCDPVDFQLWLHRTYPRAAANVTPQTATIELVKEYAQYRSTQTTAPVLC